MPERNPPFLQVIDTKIRDARHVLEELHIPSNGHGFHVFLRSGAIAAFEENVDIDNMKAHGNWNNDVIHTYLRSSISAPPAVLRSFQRLL